MGLLVEVLLGFRFASERNWIPVNIERSDTAETIEIKLKIENASILSKDKFRKQEHLLKSHNKRFAICVQTENVNW